jgi:hypothetical protein
MRVLFCMFAEDVGLLPEQSFKRFLNRAIPRSEHYWRSGLRELWSSMNDPQAANRYWSHGDAIVRYFQRQSVRSGAGVRPVAGVPERAAGGGRQGLAQGRAGDLRERCWNRC